MKKYIIIIVAVSVLLAAVIALALTGGKEPTETEPSTGITVPTETENEIVVPSITEPAVSETEAADIDVSQMTRQPEPTVEDATVEYDTKEE